MKFDPHSYWEERLGANPGNLKSVGQMGRSDLFNRYYIQAKTRALKRAIRNVGLNLKSDKVRMLDVDTGTGFWVDYFLGKGITSITGIDIVANAVESLTEKHANSEQLQFLCVDIGESGFSDKEGFDFVVAMDTLFHVVEDAKFRIAINNIACALKPDGYLFLTDSLSPTEDIIDSPQFIRWRSLAEYESVLNKNGLDIIYLAPKTVLLLNPTRGAKDPVARFFNMIYYRLTVPLTSSQSISPKLQQAYLKLLYAIDSTFTLYRRVSISTKILVAQKIGTTCCGSNRKA